MSGEEFSGGLGLVNLGNTCYLNASLQALLGMRSFMDDVCEDFNVARLRSLHADADSDQPPSLYEAFFEFYKKAHEGGIAEPKQIKKLVGAINNRFEGFAQEDAHEFLSALLNALEDEWTGLTKDKTGPVHKHFSMAVEHTLLCEACGEKKVYEEDYLDLSLELVVDPARPELADDVKLETLVEHFMSEETGLEWNCPKCQATSATISHRISRMPQILMLHLKRFVVNEAMTGFDKLHTRVRLAEELNLKSSQKTGLAESYRYRLVSLVAHRGETIRSGHYVCHARNPKKKSEWVGYDDTRVKKLSLMTAYLDAQSQMTAYVLLYEQNSDMESELILDD